MICNNNNNPMNSDGIGSKRKALELITNIFCKKSKESENSSAISAESVSNEVIGVHSEHCSYRTHCHSLSAAEGDKKSCLSDTLPKSPISPRVKNIQEDMEALMLSRQDNPYIMQQLERLSTKDSELFAELSVSANSSPARTVHKLSLESNPTLGESNFIMDSDVCDALDDNLHDKLIRSPPPQFPKNVSLFVFPGSSAASIQSLKTGDNNDLLSSRLFLSPNLSYNSNTDMKIKSSNTSNDNIPFNLKSDFRHSKRNQYLEPSPQNYLKYERRGSDSSIMSNNWKTSFYNQSMTASSSSLLSFVPRCPPIDSFNSVSNDSNMSCNECQTIQSNKNSATDLMEVCSNLDDDNSNQMNLSTINSREALLKDVSQIT